MKHSGFKIAAALALTALLSISGRAAEPAPGPVEPTWESIAAHYQSPDWFRDGKFGIMMHWGLYAVPAYGSEWYVRYLYTPNNGVRRWHEEHFGPLATFGYKDFIPKFTAAKWDPAAWAQLFADAGAKYVIPTAEHHDGFALWNTEHNRFNAANMGPKRDLIADLGEAVRKQGLKYGVSDHSINHFDFIPLDPSSDQSDPEWADFYWTDRSDAGRARFQAAWLAKIFELIDKRQPDILWFDGLTRLATEEMRLQVAAHYLNRAAEWGKQVTLSAKREDFKAGYVLDYERQGRIYPRGIKPFAWEVDDPIGEKFGYNTNIVRYKDAGLLVRRLVDCVSMNGNYLLNISPDAEGVIDEGQQTRLRAIGAWLKVNGEAIYGSRPWKRYGEGPYYDQPQPEWRNPGPDDPPGETFTSEEIRFTTRGDTLYAIVMDWPGAEAVIKSLSTAAMPEAKIESVELLGHAGKLVFTRDADGLKVKMPAEEPCDFAYALKITGLKPN